MSSSLSGRVLDLEKQILNLPSREDFSALALSNATRFNTVTNLLSDLQIKFERLNRKLIGIQITGSSTGGGGGGSTGTGTHDHVFNEVPSGTINGVNATFTLAYTPDPATSLLLFKNGLLQRQGSGNDYTLSNITVTFEPGSEPLSGSNVLASYTL